MRNFSDPCIAQNYARNDEMIEKLAEKSFNLP